MTASICCSPFHLQSRNVLSKKLMGAKGPDTIDKTNLFGMMTIMAFFMLLPIAIAVEGWQLAPAALDALVRFERAANAVWYAQLSLRTCTLSCALIFSRAFQSTFDIGQ